MERQFHPQPDDAITLKVTVMVLMEMKAFYKGK
jgi:hypothetical protein